MKTLEQVEPRTPIASAGYVITRSGSYYLTTNLTGVAGQDGITVNADDVTIDLNGFTLIGSGADSGHGIYQASTRRNLRVHNGKVVEWGGGNKGGVYARGKNNQFDHIQAAANDYGIFAGTGSTISDCTAYNNTGNGIYANAGSTISGCTAYNNTGNGIYARAGSTISGCTTIYNSENGINAYFGDGSTISGCTANHNSVHGIFVGGESQITGNTCNNNGYLTGDGAGIYVSVWTYDNRIDSNSVTANDRGIDVDSTGNLVIRNSASGNTTNYDIVAGNKDAQVLSPGSGFASTNPWANFSF
jgi:parallel beta-helix repeat protein